MRMRTVGLELRIGAELLLVSWTMRLGLVLGAAHELLLRRTMWPGLVLSAAELLLRWMVWIGWLEMCA